MYPKVPLLYSRHSWQQIKRYLIFINFTANQTGILLLITDMMQMRIIRTLCIVSCIRLTFCMQYGIMTIIKSNWFTLLVYCSCKRLTFCNDHNQVQLVYFPDTVLVHWSHAHRSRLWQTFKLYAHLIKIFDSNNRVHPSSIPILRSGCELRFVCESWSVYMQIKVCLYALHSDDWTQDGQIAWWLSNRSK